MSVMGFNWLSLATLAVLVAVNVGDHMDAAGKLINKALNDGWGRAELDYTKADWIESGRNDAEVKLMKLRGSWVKLMPSELDAVEQGVHETNIGDQFESRRKAAKESDLSANWKKILGKRSPQDADYWQIPPFDKLKLLRMPPHPSEIDPWQNEMALKQSVIETNIGDQLEPRRKDDGTESDWLKIYESWGQQAQPDLPVEKLQLQRSWVKPPPSEIDPWQSKMPYDTQSVYDTNIGDQYEPRRKEEETESDWLKVFESWGRQSRPNLDYLPVDKVRGPWGQLLPSELDPWQSEMPFQQSVYETNIGEQYDPRRKDDVHKTDWQKLLIASWGKQSQSDLDYWPVDRVNTPSVFTRRFFPTCLTMPAHCRTDRHSASL